MSRIDLLGRSALGSAALFASFGLATPAFAQQPATTATADQPEDLCPPGADGMRDPNCDPATGQVQEGNAMVVTGSRIRLPNLESNEPITTVDRTQIQERNFTNVADALNELAIFRGSVTPAGAQGSFGQGVNFVNNYGLGSNRTLTLINGRRFVTSNTTSNFGNAAAGTQVDLNVVPTILIDRADTVGIGGAPVYGSDAISGTVNIILRSKFEGLEVSAVSGITDQGDNHRWSASVLGGVSLLDDRLNLTFALQRDEVDGVLFNQRDYLRENVGGATNITSAQAAARRFAGVGLNDGRLNTGIGFNDSTTDGFPGGVLVRNVRIPFLTRGGLITGTNLSTLLPGATGINNPQFCTANTAADPSSCYNGATGVGVATRNALQFDGAGNLVPFDQGVIFSGTSNGGGDDFAFHDFAQITSDLVRSIGFGFLTFEITPEIELFAEGNFFQSRADELVQQPTFNSSLFGGGSGFLQFQANNPLLTAQAQQTLASRGVTRFQVSRVNLDLADLTGFNETEIYRGVLGVRGDFRALDRDFNFEVSFNKGHTESVDYRQDINAQNFANAVNVGVVNGQVVCVTTPTVTGTGTLNGFAAPSSPVPIADPNCRPLNIFGEGRASAEARAYIIADTSATSINEQTVVNANLGGSFFDIWGGPVAFNVGYEYRKEEGSFTPDEFTRLGRGRAVAISGISGEYELNEFFGELLVPIVSPDTDLSWLRSLQLFGRGRYVDSSINGGFFSWAVGGSIAPISDIEIRGNFTRSFRNPALTELFQPVVPAFSTVPDLCQPSQIGLGAAPATRTANCNAFLARFPGATPDTASTATVPILTGGNPNLENEQADSWTVGAIFRPSFIPRLSATIDWISITINQPIANLTVAQIVSGCFDNTTFNAADPLNGNAFCSQIRRDPTTGRVVSDPANPAVLAGFVNGQEIRFRGAQATIDYSVPNIFGLPGTFTVGMDGLYVHRRLNNITGVAPSRTDGVIGDPELSGQLRVRYVEDSWGFNTTVNYVHEQVFSRLNRESGQPSQGTDAREIDQLDPYAIVNASVFFDATDDFRFTVSVTNLFDHVGQEYFGFIIPASQVDLLGRRISASARIRF